MADPGQGDPREWPEICYMPWAGIRDEFAIGPVSFWPFITKAQEKIKDKRVLDYLARIFRCYVSLGDKPTDTAVICSIGDIDFRRLTNDEWRTIRAAVDCLIFATISDGTRTAVSSDNRTTVPPSADRFALESREFDVGRDGLGIRVGSMLHIFPKMEDARIPMPLHLGGTFGRADPRMLGGLGKVFEPSFPADVHERLFRALEWYRLAHTESDAVSWPSKAVMMTTAFEILLVLPERDQKANFAKETDKRIRTEQFYTQKRRDSKGKEHEASLAAWWSWDFYELRSRIVHGDPIRPEDIQYKDWITHLIVADVVFLGLVKRLLYEHKCVGDEVRRQAAHLAKSSTDTVEDFEKVLFGRVAGLDLDSVHEALGWIPPLTERLPGIIRRMRKVPPKDADPG